MRLAAARSRTPKKGRRHAGSQSPERQHKTERLSRPPDSKIRCAVNRSDITHPLSAPSACFQKQIRGRHPPCRIGNRAIPFLWICFLYSTVFAVCKDKKGDSFLNCPRIVIMTLSVCASWHSPGCEASGTAVSTQPPRCRNPPCCAPRCQARQAAEPKQRSRSHTSFPSRFR